MDLRCLIHGHRPGKDVGRFEDALYGRRMIGRDENYDRIYEDILCKYCNKNIYMPDIMKPSLVVLKWRLK